jgi:cell division protease FtsH
VINPEEKEVVAYHESGHALVVAALPGTDPVSKISIIPRGIAALGYTQQQPTADRYLLRKSELYNRLCVLLGGRAAEELVFGDVSTGAQDDLHKVSELARAMVTTYGMSRFARFWGRTKTHWNVSPADCWIKKCSKALNYKIC